MEPSFSTGPIIQPAAAPTQPAPGPNRAGDAPRSGTRAFWIAALVVYAAAVITSALKLSMWTLIDIWIVIVALVVAALSGSVGVILIVFRRSTVDQQGRRRLNVNPLELMGRLALVSAPLFIAIDVLIAVNCLMDPSAGPAQRVEVLNMNITESDDSTSYDLHLRSWRPGEGEITVSVDEEVYRKIERSPEAKRAAMVEARKGRLGLAWIGAVSPAD